MKQLLGYAAVDVQHVGSTAIAAIYAKPIIDIVIGLRDFFGHLEIVTPVFSYRHHIALPGQDGSSDNPEN